MHLANVRRGRFHIRRSAAAATTARSAYRHLAAIRTAATAAASAVISAATAAARATGIAKRHTTCGEVAAASPTAKRAGPTLQARRLIRRTESYNCAACGTAHAAEELTAAITSTASGTGVEIPFDLADATMPPVTTDRVSTITSERGIERRVSTPAASARDDHAIRQGVAAFAYVGGPAAPICSSEIARRVWVGSAAATSSAAVETTEPSVRHSADK
jgi:hypothetical protein